MQRDWFLYWDALGSDAGVKGCTVIGSTDKHGGQEPSELSRTDYFLTIQMFWKRIGLPWSWR